MLPSYQSPTVLNTVSTPPRRNKSGVVRKVLSSDRHSVRAHGPGSELDSAWGARGHGIQSADSKDGTTDSGSESREEASLEGQINYLGTLQVIGS